MYENTTFESTTTNFRWKDKIEIGIKELRCGLDSTGPGYGLLVVSCEHEMKL